MSSIYEKPVRELLREMIHEMGLNGDSVFSRKQVQSWFKANYPKIKEGTISAHLIRMSVNAKSRVHYNAKPGEDDLFYQIDSRQFRLYDPKNDPDPIYSQDEEVADHGSTGDDPDSVPESSPEFAYEKDLQNYLAKNLHLIEPGLTLYEEDSINGLEFPVGGRFIDILATDKDGNYVVIELKVSKGYDRVVGQLLRYVEWIRKHQAEDGQQVRGIIIARNISEDLQLACSSLNHVQLFEYTLSVALREATTGNKA